ncbi:MAG TPA: LysE family transporter [Spirochaetota bacterium]|nr:LysE family transporter [Spirochaetota bacterium]
MLIEFLFSAVILGIVVAIPPGSVTIAASQRAIKYGFRNSLFFTAGSSISDIFYIILVYNGVAQLVSSYKIFEIILSAVCGTILCYMGITSLFHSLKNNSSGSRNFVLKKSPLSAVISGILITLTNPMTIIGWLAVAGNFFLVWNRKFPDSSDFSVLVTACIMTGVLLWFVPLLFAVSRLKKILSGRILMLLMRICDIWLIFFGFIAYYNFIKLITAY